MASDVNMVVLSGRLVADPELRRTPKGMSVASLRLASNRWFRDKNAPEGEFKKSNLFITADTFGKLAEKVVSMKKKGDQLLVKGRLELNEWVGNDGKNRKDYKLYAEDVSFIGGAKKGDAIPGLPESVEAEEDVNMPF